MACCRQHNGKKSFPAKCRGAEHKRPKGGKISHAFTFLMAGFGRVPLAWALGSVINRYRKQKK
jgi:hypothetical protein